MAKFVPHPYPKRPLKTDVEKHLGEVPEWFREREIRACEEAAEVIAKALQSSKAERQL